MSTIFLNEPEDMEWVYYVHLRKIEKPEQYQSALLEGNEDFPTSILLFKAKEPKYTDAPDLILFPSL